MIPSHQHQNSEVVHLKNKSIYDTLNSVNNLDRKINKLIVKKLDKKLSEKKWSNGIKLKVV